MEAAGLAFGAVALTSLFKDCIDLFSMITAARDLGHDAAILNTKLDVERMLLLQWSDRVELLKHENYDPPSDGPEARQKVLCETHNTPNNPKTQQQLSHENDDTPLRDPETRRIVLRVLKCIRSLLSEGTALQQTYGLQEVDSSKSSKLSTSPTSEYQGASGSRLSRFLLDFERLNIDAKLKKDLTPSSEIPSTIKRIRWVIMHKDKFNNLIANLSYFNSSLMGLVPLSSVSDLSSCKEDLSRVRSFEELDVIIQASADGRPNVRDAAIAAKKAILQSQILQRLWFRYNDERRFNVKDAHYQTLRWALNPPDGYMKWDDLNTWLQGTSSIYWISGKAGSGKSTLMKYLLGHSRTLELVNNWACDSHLISASFFFYALGRPEQKSQLGLLRSLLYQLLSRDPDSIETVLPNMWQEAYTTADRDPLKLSIPSVAELKTALFDLCAFCNDSKKLFVMIDGVDEYEGGDLDATEFITKLGAFPNVKVLFSSRPQPAFVTSFSHKPKMNLPDLTRDDISAYINDNVASHPYLRTLSEIQPDATKELVKELGSKASGVFLWVVLACRSVVEGCNDFCTFSDLQARVDELPVEVEDLLRHMLDKIQPRWRNEAAKLLNLIYTNQCHRTLDPIPTLGLHFAYEQELEVKVNSSKANLGKIPSHQRTARCKIMEGLLRSRCCGLLEVQQTAHDYFCFCGAGGGFGKPHDTLQDSYVVFMHRTVYELLSKPRTWQSDFGNLQHMNLDSHATSSTIWCQVVPLASDLFIPITNALTHMYFADMIGCPSDVIIHCLSRLQFVCSRFDLDNDWPIAKHYFLHNYGCPRCCEDVSITLALAIEMGLTKVVRFALENSTALNDLLFQPTTNNNDKVLCNCRSGKSRSYDNLGSSSANPRGKGTIHPDALQIKYPILYHAVCRPLLCDLYDDADYLSTYLDKLPPRDMIRDILQLGYSPNESFPNPNQKVANRTTIWKEWIRGDVDPFMEFYGSLTRKTAETTKALLDANAEIQDLEAETLSRLLEHVDKFCGASEDDEDMANQGKWIEIRGIINSRLRSSPDTHEDSHQEKIKEESGPGSQKRAAEDDFTGPLIKRRKSLLVSQGID